MDSGDPLRENFYLLLRRSYQRAESNGKGLEFYRATAGSLWRLYADAWFLRTVFPREIAIIRKFLTETGMPAQEPRIVVQRSLFGHSWTRIWGETLLGLKREEFASIASVQGKEHLSSALASGRGIVLAHSHMLLEELFWKWLDDEGIARGVTLWEWTFDKARSEFEDPKTKVIEGAKEMRNAMDALRRGGIVHVMADGQKGERKIELPVCNRMRTYRPTFADLALIADAVVLPAVVLLMADGRLSIQIGAPFAAGPGQASSAERVEALVRQYARHHEQVWRNHPENIPWMHMRQHLNFPKLGGDMAPIDERAFVDERDLIRVKGETDPDRRKAMAHSFISHRRKDKLQVGDIVPEIVLASIDGGEDFRLRVQENRPLVLLLGSHSCPRFRRACGVLQEMRGQFSGSADFLILYVEEAHPVGEYQLSENVAEGVQIAQHGAIGERIVAARICSKELGIRMQIGVDDMENTANDLFAAWPVRVYILGAQREVLYRGGPGPYDFRMDEARTALEALLGKSGRV